MSVEALEKKAKAILGKSTQEYLAEHYAKMKEVEKLAMGQEKVIEAFLTSDAIVAEAAEAHSELGPASTNNKIIARAFWWGWHLEIPQAALDTIKNVHDVVGYLLTGGLTIIGLALPPVAVMAVLVGSVLIIHRKIIDEVNQGKGVYLSWLWVQGVVAAALPVPTPIK